MILYAIKKIHKDHNIRPVNQELYWRARKTWENIKTGDAADRDTYTALMNMDFYSHKQHTHFPSSYEKAMGPEPMALYGN